jgi:phosphotriesterase-related protein
MNKVLFYSLLMAIIFLFSCQTKESQLVTVTGSISPEKLGKTLHHEHILVDFIGADSTGYHRWNRADVIEKVLPYLLEIKELGYKTLIECTPEYLGRDPILLKQLSEKSGIQIITNVGYYSAVGAKFIPKHGFSETPEELAERWIKQTCEGIEGSGVYPGFIKIAVERKPLEAINKKIVKAACIAHKATGLTIMSHTGLAVPAFQQLEILGQHGVHPSAFIWTHAHNEKDEVKIVEAAQMGAWIGFDNFKESRLDRYVNFIASMKEQDLLNKVLISHDAGWYRPGEPDGGKFRGYTEIDKLLIPALLKNGFTQDDIDLLFITNPAKAFGIQKRLMQ